MHVQLYMCPQGATNMRIRTYPPVGVRHSKFKCGYVEVLNIKLADETLVYYYCTLPTLRSTMTLDWHDRFNIGP